MLTIQAQNLRVVRFHAPRDVRLEDAPEPTAGPGELVVRVRNCSVCGTDAKIWRSGHPNLRPPRVLGHEVAGEVAEVGQGAGGWAVGDRVQVIAAIPDGSCHECRRGWTTVCPNQELIGYQYDGGFADLLRVPAKVLADVVIVAAASGKAQEDALRMAARRGTVSFFGGLPRDRPTITCDANIIHYREVGIVGANGSSPAHNQQALELIAAGAVPVADLITHRLPLERTIEGIQTVIRGQAIKVTIEPTGEVGRSESG
jgi:threonine dehydrogenase-like Zn-dependent dehydrogenase